MEKLAGIPGNADQNRRQDHHGQHDLDESEAAPFH
jgi:hypothetical protein